jgi:hypothetical protein
MSSLAALHRLPERTSRVSLLAEEGTAELLTLEQRAPDRLFDVSEGGVGVLTDAPLPRGTLVLTVIKLPHAKHTFDIIVRVAWVEGRAMGLEFILPDDALVAAVRALFNT